MPTVKLQPEFFVEFISVKGRCYTWTPTDINKRGIFKLAELKRRAIQYVGILIDESYGREDWGFTIYKAEYGYVKGKEVFKFD